MGLAAYKVVPNGDAWGIVYDDVMNGEYATKKRHSRRSTPRS